MTTHVIAYLHSLSMDQLRDWAGATIAGRGHSCVGAVRELSLTPDGVLAVWVDGSETYVTAVRIEGTQPLTARCTCPFEWGETCKHAVAVVIAAARSIASGVTPPQLLPHGPLAEALSVELGLPAFDEDEDSPSALVDDADPAQAWLAAMDPERLRKMLSGALRAHPELLAWLQDAARLAEAEDQQLVAETRCTIARATAPPSYSSRLRGRAPQVGYPEVQILLQTLLARGAGDAVLELGDELLREGVRQLASSHDDDDSAYELGECMDVAMAALPHSSLSSSDQLLWLIEHERDDWHGLFVRANHLLDDPRYSAVDWAEVAGALEAELAATVAAASRAGDFGARRKYVRTFDRLIEAYRRAGLGERIVPKMEAEADVCENYSGLVDALLDAGEFERARHWCLHGYARTLDRSPRIAKGLCSQLAVVAEREQRYALATAYRAHEFLLCPTAVSWTAVCAVGERTDVWPQVRAALLAWLEGADLPAGVDWPLPAMEVKCERAPIRPNSPDFSTCIDIALLEQRHDDALALYQRSGVDIQNRHSVQEKLARALSGSHPEIAMELYWKRVEGLIAELKPRAYETAGAHLREMRAVYLQTQRAELWQSKLAALRLRHKAKTRLQAVLETLEPAEGAQRRRSPSSF